MVGQQLGHYQILERRSWGMGEVYRARDLRLHRDVALGPSASTACCRAHRCGSAPGGCLLPRSGRGVLPNNGEPSGAHPGRRAHGRGTCFGLHVPHVKALPVSTLGRAGARPAGNPSRWRAC